MSKQAKPALIGAFVLGGLICFIGALIFLGSGRLFRQNETFILYFNESVNGLSIGAPVKFKGVEIGRVQDIRIQHNQPADSDAIPVFIEVDTQKLKNRLGVTDLDLADPDHLKAQIRLGLRAKLQAQSYVTGMLFIELDYFPREPIRLVQSDPELPEIPTVSSQVQEIMNSVMEMLASIQQVDFAGISEELKGALAGLRKGLEALDFAALNDNLIGASGGVNDLVNSDALKNSLKNIENFTHELLDLTSQVKTEFVPLTAQMRDSLAVVETAMTDVQKTLRPESSLRVQLETTLREFARAAAAMRTLTEYLERNPSALVRGKPEPESK